MPTSPRLTEEEADIVFALAQPVPSAVRQGFLAVVIETLAANGQRGPGAAYRAAREVQGVFIADLRVEASMVGTPRYSQNRVNPHGR